LYVLGKERGNKKKNLATQERDQGVTLQAGVQKGGKRPQRTVIRAGGKWCDGGGRN